jgi:hypothetical protein
MRISTVRMRSCPRVQTSCAEISDSTGAGSVDSPVRSTTADWSSTTTALRRSTPLRGFSTPAASAEDGPSSSRCTSAVGCAAPVIRYRGSGTIR